MDKLWAPWRIKYIRKCANTACIFCKMPKQNKDKKNYILKRGKYCFSMLNIFPYNNGHLMVAPYKHTPELNRLTQEETQELMQLLTQSIELLKKKLKPHGFNIGINMGKVAGAGFARHLHVHIVPRWNSDTNFMPVITQTKVISQALNDLYNTLKK